MGPGSVIPFVLFLGQNGLKEKLRFSVIWQQQTDSQKTSCPVVTFLLPSVRKSELHSEFGIVFHSNFVIYYFHISGVLAIPVLRPWIINRFHVTNGIIDIIGGQKS